MYKKIGIIREGKEPPDRRTPLTPKQCHEVLLKGIDITVQRSPVRAYTDAEYTAQGVRMTEDLTDRDLIIGVKEIPYHMLMAEKSYLIFSHTIKKQPHNRKLLRTVLDRRIAVGCGPRRDEYRPVRPDDDVARGAAARCLPRQVVRMDRQCHHRAHKIGREAAS